MIKITLLYVILIISYVHYNQAEESTTELVPTSILKGNLVEGNVSNSIILPASKMNLNDTPKVHPDEMKGYYDWLSFLKSSTPDLPKNATGEHKTA
ncbi:unnamed protein product [Adineta ricciae]|uniref:Uncharacterized protein n=1 Tax=Adineta ricciae TaxID=249248 RepID=A0A813RQG9_ADIRI|nr:unnamed protein product [Adineta ricciae]CAF1348814.1 unnamed protein product [Adineta ricciae]